MATAEQNAVLSRENDQKCLESPKYSCALGEAVAILSNMYRVIPIMHSGAGCGTQQMLAFRWGGGHQGIRYIGGYMTPSTNLTEKEVVFGGEQRLEDQIRSTIDICDGDAYVVVNGCIAAMVGDDIGAVVHKFQDEPVAVGWVNGSGFLGNSWFGYDETFVSLIQQFTKKQPTVKNRVNLLGFPPYQDIFWRGNLRIIGDLLRDLGLEVTQVIDDFSGIDGVRALSQAAHTIVVSPWVGVRAAQELEKLYTIPYMTAPNLPVGPRETTEFIRSVADHLKLDRTMVEAYIAKKEKQAYSDLNIAGDNCAQFGPSLPFVIIGASANITGIVRFLANEASFTPVLAIINDDPPLELRDAITQRIQNIDGGLKPRIVFEVDNYEIKKLIKTSGSRLVFGSGQEKFNAQKEKQIHLSVSFPATDRMVVNVSYAGYGGGISLLEDLFHKFIMNY
jgi:nitrogenase molybdenum-iron protein beta chain